MKNFKDYTSEKKSFGGPSSIPWGTGLCGFQSLCHSMNVSFEYGWNNLGMRNFYDMPDDFNGGSRFKWYRYMDHMDGRWQWSLSWKSGYSGRPYSYSEYEYWLQKSIEDDCGIMVKFSDHVVSFFRGTYDNTEGMHFGNDYIDEVIYVLGSPRTKLS